MTVQILTALEAATPDGVQTLQVLVRLESQFVETLDRPPIHTALILDRSSSMRGEPMQLVKEAAGHFLRKLTRRDFATVVSYAGSVNIEAPHQSLADKTELLSSVQRIHPHGNTNLSGGWLAGVAELESHQTKGHFSLAVLLTDGRPNEGLRGADLVDLTRQYAAKGIRTTTIGVGQDYDAELLRSLAESSGGRYHHVRTPAAVAEAFTAEFQEINSLVAQDVELEVSLTAEADQRNLTLNSRSPVATSSSLRLPLGDFSAGDGQEVLLTITGPSDAWQNTMESLLKLRLTFAAPTATMTRNQQTHALNWPQDSDPQEIREVRAAFWLVESRQAILTARDWTREGRRQAAIELLADQAHAGQFLASHHPAVEAEIRHLTDLARSYGHGPQPVDSTRLARLQPAVRLDPLRGEVGRVVRGRFAPDQRELAEVWVAGVGRMLRRAHWSAEKRWQAKEILTEAWAAVWSGVAAEPELVVRLAHDYLRIQIRAPRPWLKPGQFFLAYRADAFQSGQLVDLVVLKESLADSWLPEVDLPGRLEWEGPVAVAVLTSKLDLTNAAELKSAILHLVTKAFVRIVIDFSGVDYVDSSGMGVLMMLNKVIAKTQVGGLVLCGVNGIVDKAFRALGLPTILRIVDSRATALQSFI